MSASSLANVPAHTAGLPPPRAFGCARSDLDLEFDRLDRPGLITDILARCCTGELLSHEAREDLAWGMPLGARIARLLRIVQITTETDSLSIVLPCPRPGCGGRFEVALPFAALLAGAATVTEERRIIPFPVPHMGSIALRLPTGRDQARWRNQPYATPESAMVEIVRSLAVDPTVVPALPPNELGPLAAAMEAADPLVAFNVHTTCPQCEHTSEIAVDLEAVALQRLAQYRRGLLRNIHALATRYGWSETEVLAIPPRRRAEYRRLIEDESTALL